MKSNYIIAIGGPYKYIRHPIYIAKALLVNFFILATGIWLSLLGAFIPKILIKPFDSFQKDKN
jgi:protein-S-isoprenylcysteine O-methyltransferase Ste14